ncbi:MAG: hypothetical protein R3A48_27745 [Polyangiales bacterium]
MEENSVTIEILREIRNEMRATREELHATREELHATREELTERQDQTNHRLDRVVQEQIRQGTTLVEMRQVQERLVDAVVAIDARQMSMERTMGRVVTELQQVNTRLDHVLTGPLGRAVRGHDERLDDLEHRVEAIERRTG